MLFSCVLLLLFLLLRATSVAYGSPRLGVKAEVQLLTYTTATQDLGNICDVHLSSWQPWILNPLSEAGDRTPILMDPSWVLNLLSYNSNSLFIILITFICSLPCLGLPSVVVVRRGDSEILVWFLILVGKLSVAHH